MEQPTATSFPGAVPPPGAQGQSAENDQTSPSSEQENCEVTTPTQMVSSSPIASADQQQQYDGSQDQQQQQYQQQQGVPLGLPPQQHPQQQQPGGPPMQQQPPDVYVLVQSPGRQPTFVRVHGSVNLPQAIGRFGVGAQGVPVRPGTQIMLGRQPIFVPPPERMVYIGPPLGVQQPQFTGGAPPQQQQQFGDPHQQQQQYQQQQQQYQQQQQQQPPPPGSPESPMGQRQFTGGGNPRAVDPAMFQRQPTATSFPGAVPPPGAQGQSAENDQTSPSSAQENCEVTTPTQIVSSSPIASADQQQQYDGSQDQQQQQYQQQQQQRPPPPGSPGSPMGQRQFTGGGDPLAVDPAMFQRQPTATSFSGAVPPPGAQGQSAENDQTGPSREQENCEVTTPTQMSPITVADQQQQYDGSQDQQQQQQQPPPPGSPGSPMGQRQFTEGGDPLAVDPAMFQRIVAASQEVEPFGSMQDPLGAGVCSVACRVPRSSARKAGNTMARHQVQNLDVGFSLFALCIEIFRDFFQLMSLMFSFVFVVPVNVRFFFARLSFLINFDITFILMGFDVGVDVAVIFQVFWWALFLSTLLLMAYLRYIVQKVTPQPRREFLMCKTWGMTDKGVVRKVRIGTFMLTLLYLPISQRALEIVTCSYRYKNLFNSCPDIGMIISSIVALIVVTILSPIMLYKMIEQNIPKRREFDISGHPLKDYTQEMYKKDLALISRKNPLASLFNPYRRKMAFFKIIIMGLKFYMVLVSVLLSSNQMTGHRTELVTPGVNATIAGSFASASEDTPAPTHVIPETENDVYNHLRPALMIVGLLAYTLLCAVQKPFLSPLANTLDVILRAFGIIAVILAWCIMFHFQAAILGWVMVTIFCLVIVASILFIALSLDSVREKVRIKKGDVTLTESRYSESQSVWSNPSEINWAEERKVRGWMAFWDGFLSYYEGHMPPFVNPDGADKEKIDKETGEPIKEYPTSFDYADTEDTTAYLLNFQGSIAERHHENREIIADIGRTPYFESLVRVPEKLSKSIIYATRMLHGRDCFMGDGEGGLEGGSFGALYVVPFPFECYHITDGSNVERRLSASDIQFVINDNCTQEVRRRRNVRELLRGLALKNSKENKSFFLLQETQSVRKQTGTDSQGHATYSMVPVLVTFDWGVLEVVQDYDTPVFELPSGEGQLAITPGFSVTFTYEEGHYSDWGGGTVKGKALTAEQVGIYDDCRDTPELALLINRNSEKALTGQQEVLARKDAFRLHFMREFLQKQKTLSYGFFPEVYDDDYIASDRLTDYLQAYEKNTTIKEIGMPGTERFEFLKMLRVRMAYFDSCRPVALWVCFWQDVFTSNLEMKLIAEKEDAKKVLNPFLPDSLSWNVMSKVMTNQVLQDAGLQTPQGKGFINAQRIDELFTSMREAAEIERDEQERGVPSPYVAKPKGSSDYFEVPGQPLYEASCVPLFRDQLGSPELAWLQEMAPGVDKDFYDRELSQHATNV